MSNPYQKKEFERFEKDFQVLDETEMLEEASESESSQSMDIIPVSNDPKKNKMDKTQDTTAQSKAR